MIRIITNISLYRKKFEYTQEEMSKIINKTQKSYSLKETGKNDFTITESIKILLEFKKKDPDITLEDIFLNKNFIKN